MGTAETGIIERWRSQLERLWPVAVAVRVIVALFLIFGPATDEADDLAGWDAERFQEISERDQPAWSGEPIEYPPGSVVIFDRLAGADVVDTHRRLVALSLIVDLGLAFVLRRRLGANSANAYLLLGLPLVPFGYQRLDLLVTAVAAIGALALLPGSRSGAVDPNAGDADTAPRPRASPPTLGADVIAATAIATGTMIKVWPLLLVVGAVAIARFRAAAGAIAFTGIAGVTWLLVTGDGIEPVDQVLSLRGATGWHVESLPGSLVGLFGSSEAVLELNAYRIGTLQPGLVSAGRALAVIVMALLAHAGWRHRRGHPGMSSERVVFSLAVLGSVAALVATAPLVSPQFLIWLTPWAATAIGPTDTSVRGDRSPTVADAPPVFAAVTLTALAAIATGIALHVFGPADLAATVPAAVLTVRNLLLVALPLVCLAALRRPNP